MLVDYHNAVASGHDNISVLYLHRRRGRSRTLELKLALKHFSGRFERHFAGVHRIAGRTVERVGAARVESVVEPVPVLGLTGDRAVGHPRRFGRGERIVGARRHRF